MGLNLSALLTARNNGSSWSKENNVLLYNITRRQILLIKILNTGLIVLDQSTDFLSVENLPKAISVSSLCTS